MADRCPGAGLTSRNGSRGTGQTGVVGPIPRPDVRDQLREQILDQIGERKPTVEDLRSMPLVDGVVRETLRLWPPGAVGARHAVGTFEYAGQTIPAGAMVLYSPYITHRLPDVWEDRPAEGSPASLRPAESRSR